MTTVRALVSVGALAIAIAAAVPSPANAEVLGQSPSGFLVRSAATIAAPPDSVYDALVGHIGDWWDPAHTYSGDSQNLSLDARPGGCFCEALPNGGGVRHLEVVYVVPGKTLRMTGGLGPLQAMGVAGSMTWSCEAAGDSTKAEMTYSVGGYFGEGAEKLAPLVDGVLREQLMRLKAYAETGEPGRK